MKKVRYMKARNKTWPKTRGEIKLTRFKIMYIGSFEISLCPTILRGFGFNAVEFNVHVGFRSRLHVLPQKKGKASAAGITTVATRLGALHMRIVLILLSVGVKKSVFVSIA